MRWEGGLTDRTQLKGDRWLERVAVGGDTTQLFDREQHA